MGFRWLFGSNSKKTESPSPPTDEPENDEYNSNSISTSNNNSTGNGNGNMNTLNDNNGTSGSTAEDEILGPTDSNVSALDDLSRPLKVPLNAIPSFMVEDRPELKLSEYDMSRGQYARNVLALAHNAVRLEMADMWGDILPSLQSRCEVENEEEKKQKAQQQQGEDEEQKLKDDNQIASNDTDTPGSNIKQLTQADADDVRTWWSGFARFALTASLVDDFICKKAFDDIYVGFDKELKQMEKLYRKVLEKNNVYLEMAVRKMAKAVDDFETNFTGKGFTSLVTAWQSLASMLADIYSESEALVESIDRYVRDPFEYKDLEKQAAKIFTHRKRWGDDDTKRGEMIVILCRWVGTEDLMREWMYRNLTKKELRSVDKWMDDYRDKRLAIIDRFHQKKAN